MLYRCNDCGDFCETHNECSSCGSTNIEQVRQGECVYRIDVYTLAEYFDSYEVAEFLNEVVLTFGDY